METVIHMGVSLRNEVILGDRTECYRPGHRDYRLGPATIQFLDQGRYSDLESVDVMVVEVVHTVASAMVKSYHDALTMLGQPPKDGDKVTRVRWALL